MNIGNTSSGFFNRINDVIDQRVDNARAVDQLDPRNNPADAQKLAEQYAPILVLPQGKNHDLPANPQDFIDKSELKENKFRDSSRRNNADQNRSNDFDGNYIANPDSDKLFLDLDNNYLEELGQTQKDPAELNYETDFTTNPPTITYHVFYAYNDGPGPQNHEGDWERITLELDPDTLEPTTALYNAHEHVNATDYDQIVDPQTGRPVVYVAAGTHAGHATPGEKSTEVPLANENTVENPNGIPIRELDDAVIYEDWGSLQDVTQQNWYTDEAGNAGVQWGDTGLTRFSSGPDGPSAKKSALENPNRASESEGLFDKFNPFDDINPFN